MGKKDPRIDAYIRRAQPFAQPILKRVREIVHKACPDVEETLKWGHPTFMYEGMLCGMASFKEHAAMGFWKGELVLGPDGRRADESFGSFGKLTSVADLPAERTLAGYVKKAVELNVKGIKVPRLKTKPKPKLVVPADLKAALKKNKKAQGVFDDFSPSKQRDYVEWLTEAKTAATREKRLGTAIEWISEGKGRNWKYERTKG